MHTLIICHNDLNYSGQEGGSVAACFKYITVLPYCQLVRVNIIGNRDKLEAVKIEFDRAAGVRCL